MMCWLLLLLLWRLDEATRCTVIGNGRERRKCRSANDMSNQRLNVLVIYSVISKPAPTWNETYSMCYYRIDAAAVVPTHERGFDMLRTDRIDRSKRSVADHRSCSAGDDDDAAAEQRNEMAMNLR